MDNLRDWDNPITAHKAREALKKSMASMSNDPDSGVKMCHKLGKTAVYLSEDRRTMIFHAPDGTIRTKPHTP